MEGISMNIEIRRESIKDNNEVYKLVKEAFETAEHADGNEQDLVNKLRESESYIPELSLVALLDNKIVGHIMFTKMYIENENTRYQSLTLAPLAVDPKCQKTGIGGKLIREGLNLAKDLGYNSVSVLGSDKYYPRFGFEEASKFGVKAPFEVPSENFMAIELIEGSLKAVNGTVVYAKEFFE